jgi:hypothetical protein
MSGSGTKKNQINAAQMATMMAIVNKRYSHFWLYKVNSPVPTWIPTILPELLQVAQSPAKKPLDFFGNQRPRIDMKHGQRKALSVPIAIIITMK